jgi:hypothetical protein
MIEIKTKDVKNPTFIQAFSKLARHPFRRAQVAVAVSVTAEALQKTSQSVQDKFVNLVKMYGDVDETGNYKIKDENIETWKKAAEEFDEQPIQLPGYKINVSELDGAGLTPVDLLALKPMLMNLELVDESHPVI